MAISVTRIVLADDHARIRMGLRYLLARLPDVRVVGEASDGREALDLVHQLEPDVLLLDMEMPGLDGIETARALQSEGSNVKILALSVHDDPEYIQGVLQMGAVGYLTKDEAVEQLGSAIQSVSRGERGILSSRAANRLTLENQFQ